MRFEVYYAAPYRIGWDLFRIGINQYNDEDQLLRNYEVWATLVVIEDTLRISRSLGHDDLVKFGVDFLKKRLEQNPEPKENGAFVSNKGIYYGQHETFPGSLEGAELSVQTNIILPSPLHEWAKIESAKSKLSLSEIIRLGLQEYRTKTVIRDRYTELFLFHNEIKSLVDSIFDREHRLKTAKDGFMSFALAKTYKSHGAIIRLCQTGYGEDAAQLVRSLFDLCITTLYIMADSTDKRIERYYDYDWIIRRRIYEYAKTRPYLVKELEKRSKKLKDTENSIEEIFKKAEEAQKKHNYNIGWSDKSIKRMAEEVGRLESYQTVYSLQSNIAHSSVRVMNDYLKLSEDGDGFVLDPTQTFNWVEESLVASFDFYLAIIDVFDKHFNLNLDEKLKDLANRYIEKVGKINKEK